MSKIRRISIAFRNETLDKLDKYMREMKLENRSKIVDEAIQLYLSERGLLMREGYIGGAIVIYFEHEVEHELTELQHEYLDVIISNTHVHLDEKNCMEAILVKGEKSKIKDLISKMERLRDVKVLRFSFFDVS
ncbi:MAG: CopG family ribbon-helix-helix protein [Candidatus Methanomethylicia archaeon]